MVCPGHANVLPDPPRPRGLSQTCAKSTRGKQWGVIRGGTPLPHAPYHEGKTGLNRPFALAGAPPERRMIAGVLADARAGRPRERCAPTPPSAEDGEVHVGVDADGLEAGGVAGGDGDGRLGQAEGLGEEGGDGGVGLALVGYGGDSDAEDLGAVGQGFEALDGVTPGIGGDAEAQRPPGR